MLVFTVLKRPHRVAGPWIGCGPGVLCPSLKGPQEVGTVCVQLFRVSRTVTPPQSVPALVLSLWMWALLWLGDFADVVILQLLN